MKFVTELTDVIN